MFCLRVMKVSICASLVAVPSVLVAAQDSSNEIVVTAPRHGQRTSSGTPIETVSHSTRVSTAGLDISTDAGLTALQPRIRAAAKKSCEWLDQHYPVIDDEADCEESATRAAMARAREMGKSR